MNKSLFIGIDIGTQGARVVLLDESGTQLAARDEVFPLTDTAREEQSPAVWWDTTCQLMRLLTSRIKTQIPLENVRAIAVTSTSGTIIPIDHKHQPLHAAIMYSDPRSAEEAAYCRGVAESELKEGYTAFNSSSGLPKMHWFMNEYPGKISSLYKFIHAADFITGNLCGEFGVTDYTNALKSGYNIHHYEWPDYITKVIGIQKEWLQDVRPSGSPLAPLLPHLASEWGLPSTVMVTTGMTDGCASQVASGAVHPGQWNTTIGTTLVIKGVTKNELIDPSGAIYNHRHPDGHWMPGGASNTGADWVTHLFSGEDLAQLNAEAGKTLPATSLAWPLIQKGERFPIVAPQAEGFWPAGDKSEIFTACLEGVAFIERFAYEKISKLSGERTEKIFSAGGGSNSDTWLRIRCAVLDRPVCKMKNVSGAAGAAILAASRTHYATLQEAAASMVVPELMLEPESSLVTLYEQKYSLFKKELKSRKILEDVC